MIEQRAGICTCHGKERTIVKRLQSSGQKLCFEGNRARLDALKEKRGATPSSNVRLTRTPLKRGKRLSYKRKVTGEKVLFDAILSSRLHISFISGKKLVEWDYKNYQCCLHVLSKARAPRFRLYEKNLVLGTAEEHRLFDQGTEAQREEYAKNNPNCDWQKLYDLKEELIKEYNESKFA